ncbi:MAG TPA: family 78 glycoside hydrolase catalytic domain [Armatimonadota bacterium]
MMIRRTIPFLALTAALALPSGASPAAAGDAAIQGNWVWTSAQANERNAYSYFRRGFTLNGAPKSGAARVAADSRYALYVNGRLVGRGSPRSHTARTPFDTWDIAPYLAPGKNAIAVLVHHYGEWTMRSQVGKAGFLCDARISTSSATIDLRTDDGWKAMPSTAWDTQQERRNRALGFVESFDARQEPAGWNGADFDDSAWPKAIVLGPAGCSPWTALIPSDIPPPEESSVSVKSVVDVLAVEPPADASRIPFAALYADRPAWAAGYAATYLHASRAMAVTLQVGSDDAMKLWLNSELLYQQPNARSGAPGQDSVDARLRPGWNRVLIKSVKLIGPWQAYFAIAGAGADEVAISSEKDLSQSETWRVSPPYPFDAAKGIEPGYAAAFAPEKGGSDGDWRLVKAPKERLNAPSTVVHHEARTRPDPPLVTGAASLATAQSSAEFKSDRQRDGAVVLDMGHEVFGYPRLTLKGARGGEIVDIAYAETLETTDGQAVSPATGGKGILNPERSATRYADRFICKAGDNAFEPFEKKAFRYVQVDVRRAMRPVTVTGFQVTQSIYPAQPRGAFSCSDERLNRIWETARQTLRLNMDDAYTDCPWRERSQWFGDVRVEALSNYYAFGDTKLIRRGLAQMAESQDAEGIVHGVAPTDWDGARLPSFSLLWVTALWEYYVYTGDASLFAPLMSAIDKQMAFFEKHRSADSGLLENVPYWVFIDWGDEMDGQRIGASASLNAMYYRALGAASDIAKVAGQPDQATRYAQRAAALKTAFNRAFWDAASGAYWDVLNAGKPNGRTGEQAAALAVSYGVAPRERWNSALDAASASPTAAKIGTPYFGAFWLDALHAAGRDQEALDYIRAKWGAMLDWGATTFWEYWTPTDSLCHGWAAGPIRDLSGRTLGLRPTKPGWRDFDFAPAYCDLQWAKGTVPTPLGDIAASWTRDGAACTLTLTLPAGTAARVLAPGKGAWTVNGSSALPVGVTQEPAASGGALRISRPGEYRLVRKG